MNEIEELVNVLANEAATKITSIIQVEHPLILANLAKEIFSSQGQSHGRSWQSNTVSTAKRKGFNRRNYESGQLMETLTEPGFLEQDDYMDKLPAPRRGSSYGYQAANDLDGFANRFDDIGRTEDDQLYIEEELGQKIAQGLASE